MPTRVKICGLSTPATLEVALAHGADYVGFVVFPPSPRNVSLETAANLAGLARGRASSVVLLVDADDGLIDSVTRQIAPDLLQLHGEETPARVAEIRARWNVPLIKAVKVESAGDARGALAYAQAADLILFDAKPPPDATRPGGHGATFDWSAIDNVSREIGDFMLSGGLTLDNVAAAIAATGAPIVDVSSGVEKRRGEKDPDLIRRFLRAAKGL